MNRKVFVFCLLLGCSVIGHLLALAITPNSAININAEMQMNLKVKS